MTATVDRPTELLEQLPIRGYAPEGHESLPLAGELIAGAILAIRREPNRMGAWRMVGAVLEARKAFKTHVALCNSTHGPLMHLAAERPDGDAAVRRLLGEHKGLMGCFDDLITLVNRDRASTPSTARALREAAEGCSEALKAYEQRYQQTLALSGVKAEPAAGSPS